MAKNAPKPPASTKPKVWSGEQYSPSAFMRARRPELYSDSVLEGRDLLTREILEYVLEHITERKSEYNFENFCRGVAQKTVCPNLIAQTGPAGGGDSWVDSETYPVAERIAEFWIGAPPEAGKERWAFAFSAKERWDQKVQDDLAKIVALSPMPDKAFFWTSQLIKDKRRADWEERLTKQFGLPVRLFDRNQLVTLVFEHQLTELAVSTLHIDVPERPIRSPGPHDAERELELKGLRQRLDNAPTYDGPAYALAEDFRRAAVLSRGLGRPRPEIDGYFAQARRIARKVGDLRQRARVEYDIAWTAHWWFDDLETVNDTFGELESLLAGTEDAELVGLLVNLWNLLWSGVRAGSLSADDTELAQRSARLISHLDDIQKIPGRPNNQAHARMLSVTIRLAESSGDEALLGAAFDDMAECLREAVHLGLFPVLTYVDVVLELGEVLGEHPRYDELFNTVLEIDKSREGEKREGQLRFQRGMQKLRAGDDAGALALLGRARTLLMKRETLTGAIRAAIGCAAAYQRQSLLWAARMELIWAINLLFEQQNKGDEDADPIVFSASMRMAWIELELGRLPCFLAWYRLTGLIHGWFPREVSSRFEASEQTMLANAILGILFLRAEPEDLKMLDELPDKLDEIGLPLARWALLWALGYPDLVEQEFKEEQTPGPPPDEEFMIAWRDQPAYDDLPQRPVLHGRQTDDYRTSLMGCTIVMSVGNEIGCQLFAENLLATLEALFATATYEDLAFITPAIAISVRAADFAFFPPKLPEDPPKTAELDLSLSLPRDVLDLLGRRQTDFHQWLLKFVAFFLAGVTTPRDGDVRAVLEKLAQSASFERALSISPLSISLLNVLSSPLYGLDHWAAEKRYPLVRDKPWDAHRPHEPPAREPAENTGGQPVKHRERALVSLIDVRLWDAAKWVGAAFVWERTFSGPPYLGLIFKNEDAAKAIFEDWRQRLGEEDANDELRISFVEGIEDGPAYVASVGADVEAGLERGAISNKVRELYTIVRHLRMDPAPQSKNLENFKASFDKHGYYYVFPAVGAEDQPGGTRPLGDWALKKRKVIFRQAADNGEHDIDRPAVEYGRDKIAEKKGPSMKAKKEALRKKAKKKTPSKKAKKNGRKKVAKKSRKKARQHR